MIVDVFTILLIIFDILIWAPIYYLYRIYKTNKFKLRIIELETIYQTTMMLQGNVFYDMYPISKRMLNVKNKMLFSFKSMKLKNWLTKEEVEKLTMNLN